MKEIVTYVALIMMEFNDEATCNAFYRNYNSTENHIPRCSMVKKYVGEYYSAPLQRPDHMIFK